jgi:2-keto-4-pentenoate hydratase/2-oxohepta-3-ene-1,7-dioic acid hydratase in catechol pathway
MFPAHHLIAPENLFMKLISFSTANGPIRPGILFEDTTTVLDLAPNGFSSTLEVIASGTGNTLVTSRLSLEDVKLRAPIYNPSRIFAIGLNYRDHAKESGMEIPTTPVIFFKLATAIIGPGDPIILPKNSTQPDYEAEFAFVIGKGGYRIPAAAWRDHVYGYTIVNDVSARDVQFASTQWSMSKCFPTFCPLGPAIVTADEIPDPHALNISLSIDGEKLQHSNTRELVFRIPELIEYISSITPLLAGDIISTGTPPGVGFGRNPKRWLKPGETVTVTIDGLGSLTNPVIAEQ